MYVVTLFWKKEKICIKMCANKEHPIYLKYLKNCFPSSSASQLLSNHFIHLSVLSGSTLNSCHSWVSLASVSYPQGNSFFSADDLLFFGREAEGGSLLLFICVCTSSSFPSRSGNKKHISTHILTIPLPPEGHLLTLKGGSLTSQSQRMGSQRT